MEENKKNYYAIIPANIRYDKRITPNAKLLYGEITALTNEKGYCWASNSYFAELYDVSKKTVSNWISQLTKANYINISMEYKQGSREIAHRYITIVSIGIENKKDTYRKKDGEPIEKIMDTPIEEKVKDNITGFNNTINTTYNNTNIIKDNKKDSLNTQFNNEFETLWKLYPNKKGKEKAKKSYIKHRKAGTTYEEVEKGINQYVFFNKQKGTEPQYIKHGSTYFTGAIWNDDYTVYHKKTALELLEEIGNG